MKKNLISMLLMVYLISHSFMSFYQTKTLYPIDDFSGLEGPRNLRTTQQIIPNLGKTSLNFQGLKYLKASGSGQFSEKNFNAMIRHLQVSPHQLIVFDLRQESHGFINGDPVSWTDGNYNYGNLHKTKIEIEADENQRLRLAVKAKKIIINSVEEAMKMTVYTVQTERSFIENMGARYIRLPVTDHNRPSNDVIDQFVELVKHLSDDQWLHFHCKAGKGRTTTFLTLFDMMKNAQQVSLKDILARQQFIGGVHLGETSTKVGEKKRAAEIRFEFIQQFYTYCQQVPDFQIQWSTWIEQQQSILADNH